MEKDASIFMRDLWNVLNAQISAHGIASMLIKERKEDILLRQNELIQTVSKLENIRVF